MNAYYTSFDQDRAENISEDYEGLYGPDGIVCFLGEPEDRRWSRDLSNVIKELNKLYDENTMLKSLLEMEKDET